MDTSSAFADVIARLFPGGRLLEAIPLGPDADPSAGGGATKAAGYGRPMRLSVEDAGGRPHDLVWHIAAPDVFGHDRRADRADALLLAFDTFGKIPRHVRPLEVGAIGRDGRAIPLGDAGELYLVTTWAPGRPYATDLRRIAAAGGATLLDASRCDALARYLVELHRERLEPGSRYRRSVRDLVGHGEGIFGMIDAYPDDAPGAPSSLLREIERRALEWRWRLRGRDRRLARIHGDFHPFNVLFDEGVELALVDASRGCAGEPADDVTAMAINYAFFALGDARAWRGLGPLWRRFWQVYLEGSGDTELLEVAAPYLAWRGLVVASPRFYPDLAAEPRRRLLSWVARFLLAPRFDPSSVEELFG